MLDHLFHFILYKQRMSHCTIISHGRSLHSPPADFISAHSASNDESEPTKTLN